MKPVKYYRDLLAEQDRIEAFRRAIHQVVQPGDRVLEVGTGLGTFAFFAADAGAAQVWAVEGHPIVHVARAIARLNGYGDRVQFIRGWLPRLRLPRPADVVIFEDFPPRLMDQRVWRVLGALRARYAVRGFRAVPAAARLFVAPVAFEPLADEMRPLGTDERLYGIDWTPSRDYAMNQPTDIAIPATALAGEGRQVGTVGFAEQPVRAAPTEEARWQFESATVVHGLAYWFELELAAGEVLSNAPGAAPGSWRHLFLPLDPPLEVAAGRQLRASVQPTIRKDGSPGWLSWELAAGGERRRGHEFAAWPASLADVTAASPDGVPRLDGRGALEARILALTDGERTLGEIARAVAREGLAETQSEAEWLVSSVLHGKIDMVAPSAELTIRGGV